MNESTSMPTATARRNPRIGVANRLLDDYAKASDPDAWKDAHLEADACYRASESVVLGTSLFALFQDLEGHLQAAEIESSQEIGAVLDKMPAIYERWIEMAERAISRARSFIAKGHEVEGVAELEGAVEQALAMIENQAFAETLGPIGPHMVNLIGPNPEPVRYAN